MSCQPNPPRADRAPKNRWSAAERATPGHAPRRRDGQSSPKPALPAPLSLSRPRMRQPAVLPTWASPRTWSPRSGADGISKPFPIQAATIPDALAGRDVLGRGRTGSGKTLAFGLPMISRLAGSSGPARPQPRGLVLVPTRELAMQVADVLAPLARIAGLSLVLVAGGMPYPPQILAFSRGVDIVVATPGRLIDLMDQGIADLSRIEITVLDEADHMADLGFLPAVTQILDTVPDRGQRLLFSATLDNAIDRLVRNYLHEPVTHQVDTGQASVPTDEPSPGQHRAAAQGRGDRRDRQPARPNVDLRPYPARGGPGRRAAASQRGAGRGSARRPRPGRAHAGSCRPSSMVRSRCWWPPTSRRAASTSTRWVWSSTLTRRAGRRSICTARDVPPGRAGRAPSSPSRCRTSVASWAV